MSKTVWSIPGGDRAPRMPGVRWTGDGIQAPAPRRRGSALVPTLIVVAALATLGLAMLSSSLDGARTVNFEDDEYSLTSAVESVAALAAENLWTGFLALDSGTPGSIAQFRTFLDGQGVLNDPNSLSGTGTPPNAQQGTEITSILNLPAGGLGGALFDSVQVDAVRIYRLDDLGSESTQLYFTVSASTQRGQGIVNPVLNRGLQVLYTVEPQVFEGFEYGLLSNNVNCIFCHTQVDTVERYYNQDPALFGSFERVRVGTLEALMIRHDMDGKHWLLNDYDADSYIAGTLCTRGAATDHDGVPIADWNALSFGNFDFDATGKIVQDAWGNMCSGRFSPAGLPLQPLENLYLDYPLVYSQMIDGPLPDYFPAPIPDDGGAWAGGGNPADAGNRRVDDSEFDALAQTAEGAIVAGILTHKVHGDNITTVGEYAEALFVGNVPSLGSVTDGNVVLSGTEANPIVIDGTIAVDGDVIINGWVKGTGAIIARGNIYVPTDLHYLDATDGAGGRIFGLAPDGTDNALGLSAGGNVLIGDFMRPTVLQPNMTRLEPGKYLTVTGDAGGGWSFSLAEMSLFNRTEWARTQPMLPAPGGEAGQPPATWSVPNPEYTKYNPPGGEPYVPRYYQFGPGDDVPIYNRGNIGFDPATGTWMGDTEVPLEWDLTLLDVMDPGNPSDPYLYDALGDPIASLCQMTPTNTWISDALYKKSIEYFEDTRVWGESMKIDALVYTNNAIMATINRVSPFTGQMLLNGSLICADLGMLVPSHRDASTAGTPANPPGSEYQIGLQLNFDRRLKDMLNVRNPLQVTLKRTRWDPTANML